MNPELIGIVNYAAAVALEVRQPTSGGQPVLRFSFKNATDDANFKTYKFLNPSDIDVPLSHFINAMAPLGINSTSEWCARCKNAQDRGCAAISDAAASNIHHQPIGPVGAGFLGAGLTFAVTLAMLGSLLFLGVLTLRKRRLKTKTLNENESIEKEV